jgi:ADP-L-glycero-D-manno-heptose 6-epimerase
MIIYLTGGAGFIGTNFIRFLNERAITEIVIVDELGNEGKWKNLCGAVFKDIINPDTFRSNISNIIKPGDIIIHLGACSSTVETNADFLWENNVKYTQHIIDFCISHNVKLIYASSAAVYGLGENGFNDIEGLEYQRILKPLNPYGFSKLKVDEFILQHGFEKKIVGLRFFNVWGNYETHKKEQASLISRITPQLIAGEKITLFKHADKQLTRDFIWVDDVCKVIARFIDPAIARGIYNVGTGQPQTWESLVNTLAKELDVSAKIKYTAIPNSLLPQYQFTTKANISKLQKAIQFSPTSLDEAMKTYVMRYNRG